MSKVTIVILLLALTAWAYPIHAVGADAPIEATGSFVNYEKLHQVEVVEKQPEKPAPLKKKVAVAKKYDSANGDIQVLMKAKVVAKWGEQEWAPMHYILDHESGGNPYAVNPHSGACGIPQALPCSKLLKVIGSLDNVDGQLDWMINYIANRYQTPTRAMQFHQSHNWY